MWRLSVMALVTLPMAIGARQASPPAATRTFSLHLLGHATGEERLTRATATGVRTLTYDFKYTDRGTEVALTSSLDIGADGNPRHFVAKGRTYRLFNVDSEVTIANGKAHVRDLGREYDVEIAGKPFFPLDTFAPIGVHEELIKYWLAHGRPAELLTAPAGPVRIASRGVKTAVERLAIDGAVWGRETAFVNAAGDVRGLFAWAGGLGFEAVADNHEDHLNEMAALAVADRMADLRAWTTSIPTVATGTFALVGATVIDGTSRAPIPNATVLVRDGRIAAVGPSASVEIPRGTRTISAAGQFVIPGLWDMHAHVSQIDWFPAYLASGVTTIRDMGGEFAFLKAAKDTIAAGALAPRLLTAGLIDGPGPRAFGATTASTPDEARALVRKYHDAGFEEIKIYLIVPPAIVPVIVDEAHKLGMTVTGHIPGGMTQQSVVEAGFDGIAHMQLRGASGSDASKAQIDFFKAHRVVMDPTQSWNELSGRPASVPLESFLPGVSRLPPTLARQFAGMTTGNGDPASAHARLVDSVRLLKDAVDAGVPVVAGTDKGVPGFSLQRELELYVEGGMTPLEAIQAATIVPARVMKLDADTGAIENGKRADLLILGSNPLDRIANIRDGRFVVVNGRLYDCATLWRAAGYR